MTDFDGRAYSLTRRDASRRERPCSLRRGRCPPGRATGCRCGCTSRARLRSEQHTSELQSLMRISYAVFCLSHNFFILSFFIFFPFFLFSFLYFLLFIFFLFFFFFFFFFPFLF